jgi:hypothetical protein
VSAEDAVQNGDIILFFCMDFNVSRIEDFFDDDVGIKGYYDTVYYIDWGFVSY